MATKKVDNAAPRRLNVRIGAAAYQRLMVQSVMSARAPGQIVAELIERNLRDWRVQSNHVKKDDRLELREDVNLAGEVEAA